MITYHINIESDQNKKFCSILEKFAINPYDAFNIFINQVVMSGELPKKFNAKSYARRISGNKCY